MSTRLTLDTQYNFGYIFCDLLPGPILESKGICAVFQKKGKKGQNI